MPLTSPSIVPRLTFAKDGAECIHRVLECNQVRTILTEVEHLPQDRAGIRLVGLPGLQEMLGVEGVLGQAAARFGGPGSKPVRAVLFDKSPENNWKLGWHQDRTVVVKRRIEVDGYGPWSTKSGLQHVAPPFRVLERMVTLRVHLDPVGADNAPLLIAPGSHKLGKLPATEVAAAAGECGTRSCLAAVGDVWVYSTSILHASDAAAHPARRRVLQVDYASGDLDGELEWLGI